MPDRKARRDPQATRERIDEAALALFAEQGFAATSTSAIAKRAGIAEGTIFRHYPTKKAMLLGVLTPVISTVVVPHITRTVREVLGARYPSTEHFLRALIVDRIAMLDAMPPFARVVLQEAPFHPEVRALFARVVAGELWPVFSAQIEALQRAGHVDDAIAPARAARMIVSVFVGYLLLARMGWAEGKVFDDEREIEDMVRVLARGLAPDEPRRARHTLAAEEKKT